MKSGMTKGKNRPEIDDQRDKSVLFHYTGPTGWGRKRDLGNYKAGKSEHDFRDQHHRFFDPTVDRMEDDD